MLALLSSHLHSVVSTYGYGTTATTTESAAGLAGAFLFGLFFGIVVYVIASIFMAYMFKKMGIPGWKAWVPVYNSWVFLEAGGQYGWLCLLAFAGFIPLIGWIGGIVAGIFLAIAAYRIGLGFGKSGAWVVLYILLPIVWFGILAFDRSQFDANRALWNTPLGRRGFNPPRPY